MEILSHWWDYKIDLKLYNTDGEKGWDAQFKPGWVSQDTWRENPCPQGAVWSLLGARISWSLLVSSTGKVWGLWKLRGFSWKLVLLRRVGWWSGANIRLYNLSALWKELFYGREARDGHVLKAAKLEVKLPHEEQLWHVELPYSQGEIGKRETGWNPVEKVCRGSRPHFRCIKNY